MQFACGATCVIAHIKLKAILALYWHPAETQEHIKQQLHLFSQSESLGRKRGYTDSLQCLMGWGTNLCKHSVSSFLQHL